MSTQDLDEALMEAATEGQAAQVKRLLNQGANPLKSDPWGDTPLLAATRQGHAACVEILLPHGDPDAQIFFNERVKGRAQGLTPLMFAATRGRLECLKLLLPRSNPKIRGYQGNTALMLAAYAGRADCVELLLPLSTPKTRNRQGAHAMDFAIFGGKPECVRLLMPHYPLKLRDKTTWTPLMTAAHNGQLTCVEALLPASDPLATWHANINAPEPGKTAADLAREKGHAEIASFIEAYLISLAARPTLRSRRTTRPTSPRGPRL